jgi:formylglycine-generating enzyme required for sulfatase activity
VRPQLGCVVGLEPARLPGGQLRLSPSDWESEGVVEARQVEVTGFRLDRAEVTVDAWRRCEAAGRCAPLSPSGPQTSERGDRGNDEPLEPGVPVTGVDAEQAATYCAFVGGRLPRFDELLFASAGTEVRRFPWGPHGLVCRRAAFGLVDGPCATGATGPELAGSRPDGASPDGVLDLVGNVAEWTREPDGTLRLFGGSFRSKVASQLKSWSSEPPRVGADVGFRCAYDLGPGQ